MKFKYTAIFPALLHRQQAGQSLLVVLKAGIGGLLAIGTMAWLSHVTGNLLLMAPEVGQVKT